MRYDGDVPVGRLTACGRHIIEVRKRSCRACGFHCLLHLFCHLLHDGFSHGGHEVLECIHRDIRLFLRSAWLNRMGVCPKTFRGILHLKRCRTSIAGALCLWSFARATSLTTIVHLSLPIDGAKYVLQISMVAEDDVGWEWAYVMARTKRLSMFSSGTGPTGKAPRVVIRGRPLWRPSHWGSQ